MTVCHAHARGAHDIVCARCNWCVRAAAAGRTGIQPCAACPWPAYASPILEVKSQSLRHVAWHASRLVFGRHCWHQQAAHRLQVAGSEPWPDAILSAHEGLQLPRPAPKLGCRAFHAPWGDGGCHTASDTEMNATKCNITNSMPGGHGVACARRVLAVVGLWRTRLAPAPAACPPCWRSSWHCPRQPGAGTGAQRCLDGNAIVNPLNTQSYGATVSHPACPSTLRALAPILASWGGWGGRAVGYGRKTSCLQHTR